MKILIYVLCVISFPLAAMLISILAEKIKFLSTYATFMYYPGCIALIENGRGDIEGDKLNINIIPKWFSAICFIVLFYFVRVSNQAHTVSRILYDRTLSNMTIIMSSLNEEEEYIPGETEVILIGSLGSNDNITEMNNIEGIKEFTGYKKMATTYTMTFDSFAKIIGYPINVNLDDEIASTYKAKEEVKIMPAYPMKGFYKMVDGKMIIKLSK